MIPRIGKRDRQLRRQPPRIEGALASVGLLALAGSPVTILAER